ncbi:MAG: flagellar biosynthesis protein FlhA [bacterium]
MANGSKLDRALPDFMNMDFILPAVIVCLVTIVIIPVPTFIMNLLIIINIALGLIIILTVLFMEDPVEFSVFPSLLLSYTVYGLAVNVTTTRKILLGGPSEVEGVITAFGNFVVGGDLIVGVIIFTIIMLIQYMVIINGTTRISEVAARFVLDSMPGKQMAIDADLNAGLIDQQEAKERRDQLQEEADFYGAMDGASKFIKGDLTAGIIIILINSIGGWLIGYFRMGMGVIEALSAYVILTVGDGLQSQIPQLMVNVATGLIVTQASDEGDMGQNLADQLTRFPVALYITGGSLITLGTVTPMPFLSMCVIGGGIIAIGRSIEMMEEQAVREAEREEAEREEEEEAEEPEDVSQILRVDPMELETGYALIPLVDPDQGGDLLDRITVIRRRMALDMGLIVPPIRIRDNMQLDPNKYIIKIRNADVADGEVYPDMFLAMNPGDVSEELEGEHTTEPAFGLPAIWISEDQRERAEQAGYTVVDPSSVVATHLTEVIKDNAAEILGRDQVQTMIQRLEQDYPALVDDVYPEPVSPGMLQQVLKLLLEERVSIRNLVTIVETLAEQLQQGVQDPEMLAEYCRMALSREISSGYATDDDKLHVMTLDPELEQYLQSQVNEAEKNFQLDPGEAQALMDEIESTYQQQQEAGYEPVMLVPGMIRRPMYNFTSRQIDNLPVLSYNEVNDDIQLEAVGQINLSQQAPAEP